MECLFADARAFCYRYILRPVPQVADFFAAHYVAGFIAVLAMHLAEAIYIHHSRLRKHQVKKYSTIWWLWAVTCFLEGFGSFKRFDGVVRELEEQAKAKKH